MKLLFIVALLFGLNSFAARADPAETKPEDSVRDQIKAARLKERADERAGPSARAWDRDSNGKRPWDSGPIEGLTPPSKPK